jgi:hypothetical protein
MHLHYHIFLLFLPSLIKPNWVNLGCTGPSLCFLIEVKGLSPTGALTEAPNTEPDVTSGLTLAGFVHVFAFLLGFFMGLAIVHC